MYRFTTFIMLIFLLTGCVGEEETKEQEKIVTKTVYEMNFKPRAITLASERKDIPSMGLNVNRYCWNEDMAVCEAMVPRDPREVAYKLNGFDLGVVFGEVLNIYYDSSDYSDLPKADYFELVRYDGDEIIPVELTYDNYNNPAFVVPPIVGSQYYSLKVVVNNEFNGIAYHPFVINAQPE